MRVLVVGAGATGGYFGARLAAAGRDVTFLVRPARAAALRSGGLVIRSPHGDLSLKPALLTADQVTEPCDVIFLSVKAFALEEAMNDMANAVGPNTMIFPVLNGMRHMDALQTRFGPDVLIGGVCLVATTLDDAGTIVQLSDQQSLTYGELSGTVTARIERLDALVSGAGFESRLSTEIRREMWEKWTLLAALGSVTCLMRGSIGEIVGAPGGAAFVHDLLEEVLAVVSKVGVPPSAPFVERTRALLTATGSGLTSSMYRDLRGGRRVEAGQIVGDLIARGAAAGLATPHLSAAFTHLSVYQSARDKAAASAA